MSLEDVLAKSEIIFPRSLELDDMKELLEHYNTEGRLAVFYQLTSKYDLGYPLLPIGVENPLDLREESVSSLNGRITDPNSPFAYDSFETEILTLDDEDSTRVFKKLKFGLIPGYELSEYRPEVIALWDKTRILTSEYFELLNKLRDLTTTYLKTLK